MKIPIVMVLAGTVCSASALLADAFPRPNSGVEAIAARELSQLSHQLRTQNSGSETDNRLMGIATSLAQLGRLEAALETANAMEVVDPKIGNSAPQTRDEVRRLVVRRRAVLDNIAAATKLIPEIKAANLRADAYLAVARAYLRRGEIENAQKMLFRVSALIRGNSSATAYTAYLFCRTGELAAGKRLFARAQTEIPQSKNAKETIEDWVIDSQRQYVKRYLLKAGLVDEWSRFYAEKHRSSVRMC